MDAAMPDVTWSDSAGIRNVVGMQFHPVTNTLYFSNNGRDQIGDDIPDDYIAYAPVEGLDFGYPHCHRYALHPLL